MPACTHHSNSLSTHFFVIFSWPIDLLYVTGRLCKLIPQDLVLNYVGPVTTRNVALPGNVADTDPTGNVATSPANVAAVDPTGNVATSPEIYSRSKNVH